MADRAHIASIEALESFRETLVIFLSKSRPALEEVSNEVVRTRMWLQSDRRLFWEHEIRRRQKALEQAQQALFSAGMSHLRAPTSTEQMAVNRARRAVTEAEEKLRRVKQWSREFDSRVEPVAKQLDQLQNFLSSDMLRGIGWLAEIIKTLEAYMETATPATLEAPGLPSATEDATPGPSAGDEPGSPGGGAL